jgi:hypothetical protein
MTRAQMQLFETFYRDVVENHEGEFYARWIGRGRVVAFAQAYEYAALGRGWILSGRVIRTRVDFSLCDAHASETFGAIYRADLAAADNYRADITAADNYRNDFDLGLIAANEC